MARIFLKEDEPMNSFWDYLSSVSSRDYEEPYNLARLERLEEALRLQGVLPALRVQLGGANQRKFVAALLRFSDENEICSMPTRNAHTWNEAGHSSVYVDYLDALAKLDLVKYNRTEKTLRPTASLANLAKLTNTKFIAA